MKKWLKIQKLFHRGVINWQEAHNTLLAHDCPIPSQYIGTEAEYEQALRDAGIYEQTKASEKREREYYAAFPMNEPAVVIS